MTDWIIERASRYETRRIDASTRLAYLDPERVRRFWQGMRRHDPELAELVAEIGPLMRKAFGASLVVTDEQAKKFMTEDKNG